MKKIIIQSNLITNLAKIIYDTHGSDLSKIIVILPNFRALISFQNAFNFTNEIIILPQIWILDQIQDDMIDYVEMPNVLSKNISILLFAQHILDYTNYQNLTQTISLSEYLFNFIYDMNNQDISLEQINEFILKSPYKKNLYKEYPIDLVIKWEKTLNYIPYYRVKNISKEQIINRINQDNASIVYFVECINEYISLINNTNNIFNVIYQPNSTNYPSNMDYYEFTNCYQQIFHISNLINDQILQKKNIGIFGLNNNLRQVLEFNLQQHYINIKTRIFLSNIKDYNDFLQIEPDINFLKNYPSFYRHEMIIRNYLLQNTYLNLYEGNDLITIFNNINDIYYHNCDTLIFICQNNFPAKINNDLKLIDEEKYLLHLEKKYKQAMLNAQKIILTYTNDGIYPLWLAKLKIENCLNKCQIPLSGHQDIKLDHLTQQHNDKIVLTALPDQLSLTALDNLVNNPYKFFVLNILNLQFYDNQKDGLSTLKLGIIFHKILEQLILEKNFSPQKFYELMILEIQELQHSSKYELIYKPLIMDIADNMCNFLSKKIWQTLNIELEKQFNYESIVFRCDALIYFTNNTIQIMEYKFSDQFYNAFRFQIIMEIYMLTKILKCNMDKIFGTYIKVAPQASFNTQNFFLRDNLDIIEKYNSIMSKSEHIITYQGDLNYRHFARDME